MMHKTTDHHNGKSIFVSMGTLVVNRNNAVYNNSVYYVREVEMLKITKRQKQVLELIETHINDNGIPPTRADIAKELGFKSANAAEDHLKALSKKGLLEIVPGASRGIRLKNSMGIPIVGRVAAGSPILAQEHIEDYCKISPSFFKPAADYFLTVSGDSMINAGIHDGDLLAVHKTSNVKVRDIVVARIDDEVTVKRFQTGKQKNLVELHPENPHYEPIVVDLQVSSFEIEGLSVGIIRR